MSRHRYKKRCFWRYLHLTKKNWEIYMSFSAIYKRTIDLQRLKKKHFKWCLKWSTKRTNTSVLSYACQKCIKKITPFWRVSFTFLDLLFNLHCQIHSKKHPKLDWRILWYMSWASWWWQVRIFSRLSKQIKKVQQCIV